MTGATSSVNGASGAVPQPLTGQQNSFLRGDGTWGMSIYKGTVSIGDVGGTSGNLPVSGDIISATTTTGSAVSITINHPSVSANAIYNITTENISNQLYANDITQTVFTRISNNQIRVYYEETSTSVQGIKLNIMIYD
jgi:Rieske Fe-S protein